MFGEDESSIHVDGKQIRAIVDLLDSMAEDGDGDDITEQVDVAERKVFQYDKDLLYVRAVRWMGNGGRNRVIEVYLTKEGDEVVRKTTD